MITTTTMNWIDKMVEEFKDRVAFIEEGIDRRFIRHYEHWLRTALQEAHTKGTQEALAKVEEWASDVRSVADKYSTPSEVVLSDEVYNEVRALEERLLHHLQQLKDNQK